MAAATRQQLLALVLLSLLHAVAAFTIPAVVRRQHQCMRMLPTMAAGSVKADPLRPGDRVVVIGSSGGCGQLIRFVYDCLLHLIPSTTVHLTRTHVHIPL